MTIKSFSSTLSSGTNHISAPVGQGKFGEVCLCPGDPLRAKFIAETFLKDVEQINTTRNMNGYTGYYKGLKVSVMATGMGIPSLCIYLEELIKHYGVKIIIRTGTCGSPSPQISKMGDIVLAIGAGTDSNINRMRFEGWDCPASASFKLLYAAYNIT